MIPTRRTFGAGLGAAALASACESTPAPELSPAQRIDADVAAYVGFGHHRTGGAGDVATRDWLQAYLRTHDYAVELDPFAVNQIELERCAIDLPDGEIEAFPLWLPRLTDRSGLAGRLVQAADGTDVRGAIAVIPLVAETLYADMRRAAEAGAIGVAAVGRRMGPSIAQNAWPPFLKNETPVPTVLVGGIDKDRLAAAVATGATARLVLLGQRMPTAQGHNVLGVRRGEDRWIVVSTPYSGWFTCGGERGAGVAIWRAIAAELAHRPLRASLLMVANSGHELGYSGAHHTLEGGRVPSPDKTLAWLHLGASIGVNGGRTSADGAWTPVLEDAQTTVQGVAALEEAARASFLEIPKARLAMNRTSSAPGELGNIISKGYRGVGLIGGSPEFGLGHTRLDGARSVSGGNLSRIAAATLGLLRRIDA